MAEFTIAPRFAYDDLGAPPLVPPDATLVFEVELVDWENKSDVLGDGRPGDPGISMNGILDGIWDVIPKITMDSVDYMDWTESQLGSVDSYMDSNRWKKPLGVGQEEKNGVRFRCYGMDSHLPDGLYMTFEAVAKAPSRPSQSEVAAR